METQGRSVGVSTWRAHHRAAFGRRRIASKAQEVPRLVQERGRAERASLVKRYSKRHDDVPRHPLLLLLETFYSLIRILNIVKYIYRYSVIISMHSLA